MRKHLVKGICLLVGFATMGFLMSCDRHSEAKSATDIPDETPGAERSAAGDADAVQDGLPEERGDVMVIYGPAEDMMPAYDGNETQQGNDAADSGDVDRKAPEEAIEAIYGPPEMLMPPDDQADQTDKDKADEEIREFGKIREHEMIQALYGVTEPRFER